MKSRGDFKSQIISMQKPRKRHSKTRRSRSSIDLMELHKNLAKTKRQRKPIRYRWIKGLCFALMAIVGFFLLGYIIAALSMPMWAKIMSFTFIAVLGIIASYIVAALFRSQ